MGCDSYWYRDKRIMFSEGDDDVLCLCTFPHNDEAFGEISSERVRSLAYLGATIVLIHENRIEQDVFIPYCLPEWIKEQIDKRIK
jgi:hypothetical protein